MKIILGLVLSTYLAGLPVVGQTINGAGATFPYPVYSQWAHKYNQITGIQLNYQSIGSGGGIQQIKARTVDFGASDAPLTAAELDSFGMLQFPLVMGGVVPVVNVEGLSAGQLKLTAEALVSIYLGKITKWNDPALAALNPGLPLPNKDITAVYRSDGSGTTWIFTQYLATVSPEWREEVGAGKAVSWPAGVGGKGNEGVAAYVQRIAGSIGYVEYAYALQNKLHHILLRNRDGEYVAPTAETFTAAAAGADWGNAPGFYMVLVDQPGKSSWPITGASFIILYRNHSSDRQIQTMLTFFDWCFKHGSEIALSLDYVPMPEPVVKIVEQAWSAQIRAAGKPVWK